MSGDVVFGPCWRNHGWTYGGSVTGVVLFFIASMVVLAGLAAVAYGCYWEYQRRQSQSVLAMAASILSRERHPANGVREARPIEADQLLAEVEEWLKQQQ